MIIPTELEGPTPVSAETVNLPVRSSNNMVESLNSSITRK